MSNSFLQRSYALTIQLCASRYQPPGTFIALLKFYPSLSSLLSLRCSESSAISWSDDDTACDFTDRFERCARGRKQRVEDSASPEASADEECDGDEEDSTTLTKRSEEDKQTQTTTTTQHAKVETAVKVGGDKLCCLEARPIGL